MFAKSALSYEALPLPNRADLTGEEALEAARALAQI